MLGEDADGLISRFQLMVYPDPPPFINVDRYPDTKAKNEAYQVFRAFEALDPLTRGCLVDEDRNIPYLMRSHLDAQAFFDDWRFQAGEPLAIGEVDPLMASHLSKYRKLMPALSLIIHLVELHGIDDDLHPSRWRRHRAAAAWCEYLEEHARRIYQSARDGDPEIAISLANRLKQGSLPNPFTYRVAAQKGWSGLATVDEVRRAVGVLEDRGWVRIVEVESGERGGRPYDQVWINPHISGAVASLD